jgi:hypothetical protein
MQIQNDAALARVLGLSKAAVSRAKKRGMPTHSIEAARAWRDQNLNPMLRKDINTFRKVGSGYSMGKVDPRARIERVQALMELGGGAIRSGTFDALKEPIQKAMRDVPNEHREKVMLSAAVMDALLTGFPMPAADSDDTSAGRPAPGAAMSDEEAAAMGAFWFSMAAGEQFDLDRLGISALS